MNKYTEMQKKQYELDASNWSIENRDPVVGSFDQHNEWADYNKFLFKDIDDCQDKILLDFGCGPGRNLVKYKDKFKELHGIDIAKNNIDNAKKYLEFSKCDISKHKLYINSGIDLEVLNDDIYDVVMSTICMQHICVYDIRFSLLKEFYRVLKPGGYVTVQMGFGPKNSSTSVDYYANFYDASGTNSLCDTRVENPEQLKNDLEKVGFSDFNFYITQVGPGDYHHPNWIFFNARKA